MASNVRAKKGNRRGQKNMSNARAIDSANLRVYKKLPPVSSSPSPPSHIHMDRFLAPHTSEALAHSHLTYVVELAFVCLLTPHSENWFTWDQDHPSFNETLVAGCASYQAFNRYLSGSDLFIVPRSRGELESVLYVNPGTTLLSLTTAIRRRYAYDSIHNAIAISRQPLQRGGYSRVSHIAHSHAPVLTAIRHVCSPKSRYAMC